MRPAIGNKDLHLVDRTELAGLVPAAVALFPAGDSSSNRPLLEEEC